jgi:hypothetical protein
MSRMKDRLGQQQRTSAHRRRRHREVSEADEGDERSPHPLRDPKGPHRVGRGRDLPFCRDAARWSALRGSDLAMEGAVFLLAAEMQDVLNEADGRRHTANAIAQLIAAGGGRLKSWQRAAPLFRVFIARRRGREATPLSASDVCRKNAEECRPLARGDPAGIQRHLAQAGGTLAQACPNCRSTAELRRGEVGPPALH